MAFNKKPVLPGLLRVGFIKKQSQLSDYCILSSAPEARLSQFERLTMVGGSELERALQWIIKHSSVFTSSSFSSTREVTEFNISAFLRQTEFYSAAKWRENPSSFFEKPEKIPDVKTSFVHGLKDGVILDLEFKSSYQVQNPEYVADYLSFPENNVVHARMWQHDQQARSTLVALHGWTMGDQRLNSLAFLPGLFYQLGMDVVLLELPFHGRRRPKGMTDDPGNLFPNGNLARTNESLAQVISDLRSLTDFLKDKGATNIGCAGMSLGAYVSSLWASLEPLAFCIPIVPVVSMAEIAWSMLRCDPEFKQMRAEGLKRKTLSEAYFLHCPLNHQLQLSPDKVMILAGLADRVVPSAQPKLLLEHWNYPAIQWFRGGHLAQFKSRRATEKIVQFFKKNEFI